MDNTEFNTCIKVCPMESLYEVGQYYKNGTVKSFMKERRKHETTERTEECSVSVVWFWQCSLERKGDKNDI